MSNTVSAEQIISSLNHGQYWTWPKSDYGLAEVWRVNDVYLLFHIPEFGGPPTFVSHFPLDKIHLLVSTVLEWT